MNNSNTPGNAPGTIPVTTLDVALDSDFAEVVEVTEVVASIDWTKKEFIDKLLARYAQHVTGSTPPIALASPEAGAFEYFVLFPVTVEELKPTGLLNLTSLFNDLYDYEYTAVDRAMPVFARMTALSKLLRQFRKTLTELCPSATGDFPKMLPFGKPAEIYELWFCFYSKLPSGELSNGVIKFKVRLLSPPLAVYDATL